MTVDAIEWCQTYREPQYYRIITNVRTPLHDGVKWVAMIRRHAGQPALNCPNTLRALRDAMGFYGAGILTLGLSGGPQVTMLRTTQKHALWAVRLQAFVRRLDEQAA